MKAEEASWTERLVRRVKGFWAGDPHDPIEWGLSFPEALRRSFQGAMIRSPGGTKIAFRPRVTEGEPLLVSPSEVRPVPGTFGSALPRGDFYSLGDLPSERDLREGDWEVLYYW